MNSRNLKKYTFKCADNVLVIKLMLFFLLSVSMSGFSLTLQKENPVKQSSLQQKITVKGNIKNQKGEPVIDAKVFVKETSKDVKVSSKGNFTLKTQTGLTLEISCKGYKTQNVTIKDNTLNLVLEEVAKVPGTVIAYRPASSKIYISGPNILVLPNGDYIACHDLAGPPDSEARENKNSITRVYKSKDKGLTWRYITYFQMHMGKLFQFNNSLYMIGINPTDIVIRESKDGGDTWTNPTNKENGILLAGKYHTASTPVLIAKGRIWKAFEDTYGYDKKTWGKSYRAFMMSAPIGSDLLKASSWTSSNALPFNEIYLDGLFGGWLEGNAVITPEGEIVDMLRVFTQSNQKEYVAHVKINDTGDVASFNPKTGFHELPGSAKKFVIKYDSLSRKYITLANYVPSEYIGKKRLSEMRNTLALCSSSDLLKWSIDTIVLQANDYEKQSFQYIDWDIDGNDMVYVSRTSFDDEAGGANSFHNSNFFTFHRLNDFRKYIK